MAHVGRNDPCPCGSGRKYKHCCLKRPGGIPLGWGEEDAPPGGGLGEGSGAWLQRSAGPGRRPSRQIGPASAATDPVDAIDPADPAEPRDPWTGLTADDLFAILEDPFGVPERVGFPKLRSTPPAPVLAVFETLAEVAAEGDLTTRADGSLTAQAVKAFERSIGADMDDGAAAQEAPSSESSFVALTRLAAQRVGLLRDAGGRLVPTASARRLLGPGREGELYQHLFRALAERVEWSDGDDLPDLPLLEAAWPFVLLLLRRFGDLGLPENFYAAAYLDAFPLAPDEAAELAPFPGEDAHEVATDVFVLRALLGFAALLGLAVLEPAEDPETGEALVRDGGGPVRAVYALPLLERVMRLQVDQPDAVSFFEDDAPALLGDLDDEAFGDAVAGSQGRQRNAATDVLDELRTAMAEREFGSLEELQTFSDAFIDERNRSPLEDFDGLSPEQMHRLLTEPFGASDLLEVPEVLAVEPTAPILDLFLPLAEALSGDGLKATAKGNLPRAFCRDLAARYFTEERLYLDAYASVSGHREEDFRDLHYTRRLARKAGLIRLARGRWRLTVRGRELLKRHGAAGVYPRLLRAAATTSPWPREVEDGLDALIRDAWPFTAWLLTRHGEEPRPSAFYQEAFVRAFPQAVDALMDVTHGGGAPERGEGEGLDTLAAVVGLFYAWSGLRQFAGFLGLARLEAVEADEAVGPIDGPYTVRATPLLRDAVRFRL